MKISVKNVAEGEYAISFDGAEFVLNEDNVKDLLLKITQMMLPLYGEANAAGRKAKELARIVKSADDIGVQKIISTASVDDIVVFLKASEKDGELSQKLYGNMSERLRKMITEDLKFKFKDNEPANIDAGALARLIKIARSLEEQGILTYTGASGRI